MSIIQAAGSGEVSTGFYKHLLDQSLKFDDGKSSALSRTPASAGNQRLWTFSAWVKKSTLDIDGYLLGIGTSSTPEFIKISNSSTDQFEYAYWNGSVYVYQVRATALLRDTSAWYHIVLAVDTAQGTAANRVKFYVNGTQLTDFSISTYPTQNADTRTNAAVEHRIGSSNGGGYYDGYIAEVNFIDGAALTPASFGETKNGIWVPKDTSGLTFGTNGFHLTFKDDVVCEGFNTVTYTGTGANNSISGIGFDPALVWIKSRSNTYDNQLYNTVRGPTKRVFSNKTDAESTGSDLVQSFDADGFTIGTNVGLNNSGSTYVGWCWEAGGTPTADNSAGVGATPTAGSVKIDGSNLGSALAGSIAATRISANTARGFSITTYTGTGGTKTVAHGLGATPTWVMIKVLVGAPTYWRVFHTGITSGQNLLLNDAAADSAYADRIGTNNTSSVVEVIHGGGDPDAVNANGGSYLMYSWTDITGYSKFGSYTGNANATGPSVTLGFAPAWILIKNRDAAENWYIWDNTREPAPAKKNKRLHPNLNVVEQTSTGRSITFTATGFQVTDTDSSVNGNGNTFIYAAFADTRSAAFFKDVTTNGNHFTPVNLDYRDSVPDTPTNNFSTLNPLVVSGGTPTLSEGNLKLTGSGTDYDRSYATIGLTSGKWYVEFFYASGDNRGMFGVVREDATSADGSGIYIGSILHTYGIDFRARAYTGTSATSSSGQELFDATDYDIGDIGLLCFDIDNGKLWFGRRDVSGNATIWYDSNGANNGDPSAGSNPTYTGTFTGHTWFIGCHDYNGTVIISNFGQDGSFSGSLASQGVSDSNGIGDFNYIESGFLALCSLNSPDVEITDGSENFVPYVYTANNASTRDFTGIGFAPDFLWFKGRTTAFSHALYDVVRGVNKGLQTNSTGAENTYPVMTAFGDDGFSTATDAAVAGNILNNSTDAYVAWAWLAGTAFSNDASATGVGTIDSEGQVNTTAGFAIIKYTGTRGSDGGETGTPTTIAHGLGKKPTMVITKRRDNTGSWNVWHQGYQPDATYLNYQLKLESTDASNNAGWQRTDTGFSTTVFCPARYSYDDVSGATYIAYVFTDIEGFSKAGSYVGNGSANGQFVFTGHRPSFLLVRRADGASHWQIYDAGRHPDNVNNDILYANLTDAETVGSSYAVDFLSNGFKVRTTGGDINASGGSFIYFSFADQPFKFSNAR